MRDWSLTAGDPLYLTLAADSRLCKPDYVNDHIWEVALDSGEPAAIALQTTFGLRATRLASQRFVLPPLRTTHWITAHEAVNQELADVALSHLTDSAKSGFARRDVMSFDPVLVTSPQDGVRGQFRALSETDYAAFEQDRQFTCRMAP